MKKIIILFTVFGLTLICCLNRGIAQNIKSKIDMNNVKQVTNYKIDKSEYFEIKQAFDKGYYLDLNRLISQFLEYRKNSIYIDTVKMINIKLNDNRRMLQHKRDSLSHLSAFKYYRNFNLPRLDSISISNYELIEHDYKLNFIAFDKKNIKSEWEESWYLSKQFTARNYICIAICHNNDCEASIMLYSIDSLYNIIDKQELCEDGCYNDLDETAFKYKNYLVNYSDRYSVSHFNNDSTFTKTRRTFFSLKDTKTNKVTIETGEEDNVTFNVDPNGKFKILKKSGFKKEYVDPYNKAQSNKMSSR
jgi:hypothetical protein